MLSVDTLNQDLVRLKVYFIFEEEEEDDFSQLFSSLGEMKERAKALPAEERRRYAEKIALAFLKSFGDEEADFDSDDDDDRT